MMSCYKGGQFNYLSMACNHRASKGHAIVLVHRVHPGAQNALVPHPLRHPHPQR